MKHEQIKQRFDVIGNSRGFNRAIDIATQVAPTDLTVFITGESGAGKEVMPQIIHQLSARKHNKYIAVNCGAIPEGTIDSELFGHEKGSFTGAYDSRKGYFEVADGGTIFLDEVAELPLPTQARLLRVLESGEFIKVGSSKVLKTDVRIVAATNVNIPEAIKKNKFREDLFYRLNTVPILIPPLRERKEDIYLLFRKFASDFAERYRMPPIRLDEAAKSLLVQYRWPGNIRQLKNVTEQISVIEKDKQITEEVLRGYLTEQMEAKLPVLYESEDDKLMSEREILYKVLFEMKKDVHDLKHIVRHVLNKEGKESQGEVSSQVVDRLYNERDESANEYVALQVEEYHKGREKSETELDEATLHVDKLKDEVYQDVEAEEEEVEESLSIADAEKRLIIKALEKHDGKRKYAAEDLGVSERTLYRKIKEYEINR